jgi:hypothetical protein
MRMADGRVTRAITYVDDKEMGVMSEYTPNKPLTHGKPLTLPRPPHVLRIDHVQDEMAVVTVPVPYWPDAASLSKVEEVEDGAKGRNFALSKGGLEFGIMSGGRK